ncbi:hypothetical protein HMI55_000982, partial [Coelomomyces lativittatus]
AAGYDVISPPTTHNNAPWIGYREPIAPPVQIVPTVPITLTVPAAPNPEPINPQVPPILILPPIPEDPDQETKVEPEVNVGLVPAPAPPLIPTTPLIPAPPLSPDTFFGLKLLDRLDLSENTIIAPLSLWSSFSAIYFNTLKTLAPSDSLLFLNFLHLEKLGENIEHDKALHTEMLNVLKRHSQISLILQLAPAPTENPELPMYDFFDKHGVFVLNEDRHKQINTWINKATLGNITHFLRNVELSHYSIVSALSFDGKIRGSVKLASGYHPFKFPRGSLDIEMLDIRGNFKYMHNEEYEAMTMPYSESNDIALVIQSKNENNPHLSNEQLKNAIHQVFQSEEKIRGLRMPSFDLHSYKFFTEDDFDFHYTQYVKPIESFPKDDRFTGLKQVQHQVRLQFLATNEDVVPDVTEGLVLSRMSV